MKKRILAAIMSIALFLTGISAMTACSQPAEVQPEEPAGPVLTAVEMVKQGNPTSINLADIAETDKAWIKISTQFDKDLSMYMYDTIPSGTCAIAVKFTISDFDCGESNLYWGYQLISGGETYAVWDGTSVADTLTVTDNGKYMIVFDAQKAIGGNIDTIESFQLVFPCGSESTTTKVSVNSVKCITDPAELEYFVTGPVAE